MQMFRASKWFLVVVGGRGDPGKCVTPYYGDRNILFLMVGALIRATRTDAEAVGLTGERERELEKDVN